MVESADLLVEIGTEEMPPKSLRALSETFEKELIKELEKCDLRSHAHRAFATPRRLAMQISGLALKQKDQLMERKGPALSAAFDAQGNPTRAAMGFARSCSVEVKDLQRLETNKGAWLVYRTSKMGESTITLLPEIIERTLTRLPIPRRMRWGSGETEFVRPVHWVVLLLGDKVVDTPILGLKPGRESRGHRFHHPDAIRISTPAQYAELLEQQGKVLTDFELRRDKIRSQVEQLAQQLGGQALLDDELLDEVTSLVEWPQALAGSFDEEFLNIPPEVLISTMQDNQKYFPILDTNGKLLPHFIVISNIESTSPQKVLEGNERVIRPRFRDAEFFWKQDCKATLASRRQALKEVVFQRRLGSLFDKSQRLISLTQTIARLIDVDTEEAQRAAELCKCDLLTHMVNEFPKLQGIMGRYYAHNDGEKAEVAASLDEHYMPRQAGGPLPQTRVGLCLALADRLDTLLGIFAIGQRPTGVKDPYALRRAALGVLRIIIECRLELDLRALLLNAAEGFPEDLGAHQAVTEVFDYIMERLRAYYLDRGMTSDAFEAVLACHTLRPLDFDRRIHAVTKFRSLAEATSLSQTNKRIRNILKQASGEIPLQVQNQLLQEPAEQELNERLNKLSLEVEPLFDKGEYEQGLRALADLRKPVDRFFDEVMVMVDEDQLRTNRIALLNRLSQLFLRTADLSRLQN